MQAINFWPEHKLRCVDWLSVDLMDGSHACCLLSVLLAKLLFDLFCHCILKMYTPTVKHWYFVYLQFHSCRRPMQLTLSCLSLSLAKLIACPLLLVLSPFAACLLTVDKYMYLYNLTSITWVFHVIIWHLIFSLFTLLLSFLYSRRADVMKQQMECFSCAS